MRMTRVYIEQALQSGSHIQLDRDASHYLSKVLRCKSGQALRLFNGEGGEFAAVITALDRKSVSVEVGEFYVGNRCSDLAVHLGIALSRGDKPDLVIQKSTELGVSAITPLFSERSEIKLDAERMNKKLVHWQGIARSACEQCQRNLLPQIHPPVDLQQWITAREEDLKLVLHHRNQQSLDQFTRPRSVAVLIGPEGGLSDAEIEFAEAQGFHAISLGPRVLRTETAPLSVLSILQFIWGDMNPGGKND